MYVDVMYVCGMADGLMDVHKYVMYACMHVYISWINGCMYMCMYNECMYVMYSGRSKTMRWVLYKCIARCIDVMRTK